MNKNNLILAVFDMNNNKKETAFIQALIEGIIQRITIHDGCLELKMFKNNKSVTLKKKKVKKPEALVKYIPSPSHKIMFGRFKFNVYVNNLYNLVFFNWSLKVCLKSRCGPLGLTLMSHYIYYLEQILSKIGLGKTTSCPFSFLG